MASVPTSCSYCNAQVMVPTGTAPGQRLACPRCGEMFAFRGQAAEPQVSQPVSVPALSSGLDGAPASRRWSNLAVASVVLSVMALMGSLGVALALWTQQVRRAHDKMKPPRSELLDVPLWLRITLGAYLFVLATLLMRAWLYRKRTTAEPTPLWQRVAIPVAMTLLGATLLTIVIRPRFNPEFEPETDLRPVHAVPPAELAELGYLHDGVNLVAGLHVAEALETPAGKQALNGLRVAGSDFGIDMLVRLTGMERPDELEHIVLGMDVHTLTPPMTLVVRTRRPYNEQRLHETMPTTWQPEPSNKPLRGITLKLHKQVSLQGALWCADDRTLVVFISVPITRINQVPTTPLPGAGQLPQALQKLLRERTGEGVPAWLVGQPESWDRVTLLALELFVQGQKEELALLGDLRVFGLFVRLGDGATVNGAFEASKPETADRLEAWLREHTKGLPGPPAIATRKEPTGPGTWVTLDNVQVSGQDIQAVIGRGKP